jgi:asparagine synthase (glutamine-hydrolysing)
MTAEGVMVPESGAVDIAIREEYGWRCETVGAVTVWIKGHGRVVDCADQIAALSTAPSAEAISALLLELNGFFALAARGPGWAFAAVDWVRSIPVAWTETSDGSIIDDQAGRLAARLGLGAADEDPGAGLALGMAGYTIDTATLFPTINQLGPGEFALFRDGAPGVRHRYYTYRPWRADKPAYDPDRAGKQLAELTLAMIDELMRGLEGRMLVVPLSAGRDSRLIVSAARHLGYDNVRTFAYGRPGNHEALTSKAIAERLGYDWRFVPVDPSFMRQHYASADWRDYNRFADSLQSVPFVQDLPQIQTLKADGYIPADAVLCNGNSGDYISGLHLVPSMRTPPAGLDQNQRLEAIVGAVYDKHFALWEALRTSEARASVTAQLKASLARAGAVPDDPQDDYGLYEYAEFQDRQCKYVITGQRIYEYLGHDWRLPLWDKAYLDFFEPIPLEGKVGQKLYADMLENANWGGVWQNVPINAKTIRPGWIRPLRWAAKALHAPLGRAAWHRSERNWFSYWMEGGSHSAIVPYRQVAVDRRGARHGVAWQTEAYLNGKGIDFGGRVMGGDDG